PGGPQASLAGGGIPAPISPALMAKIPRRAHATHWVPPWGQAMFVTDYPGFSEVPTVHTMRLTGSPGADPAFVGLTFSADGRLLCCYNVDLGSAILWDIHSTQVIHHWQRNAGAGAAFSPSGQLLAVASPSAVSIYESQTGRELCSCPLGNHWQYG